MLNKLNGGNTMQVQQQAETIKKAKEYKKAHLNLIRFALNKGYNITVYVEGETELKKSKNFKAIKDSVECADETVISIRDNDNKHHGNALIIPFNYDTDIVSDYHCTPFFYEWEKQYEKLTDLLQI